MKYLLAIAVSLAGAMLPCALPAQSFHPTLVPQGAESSRAGGSRIHSFLGQSQMVVIPPFFGYALNYPFEHFYPGLWPPIDEEYQQAFRIAHGDVAAEVAAQEKDLLSRQVQALADEVHSLREQQSSRQYVQSPALPTGAELPLQTPPHTQSVAQQKFPATLFIYRDGREMEARDYAIFGTTLWVFKGGTSRKFPLSDFNLGASRQINEEHGVEFPLPNRQSQ